MESTPSSARADGPDFAARRRQVLEALDADVMVLPAAPRRVRSRDTEYTYRPDSDLFWVTGAVDPETVAVLVGGAEPRLVVFVPEPDPVDALWNGPRPGPDEAAEALGADEAHPLDELERRLPALIADAPRVHFRLGHAGPVERTVLDAYRTARVRSQRHGRGPRAVVDPGAILDDLRVVKDAWEIEVMRRAAEITVAGHRAGMAAVAPGVGEWTVQAAIEGSFRRDGAEGPGFATIVGAGEHACVLHYVANRGVVGPNDLVLLDAGAEYRLYQGDVTRTVPASGRFTPEQRAVYEVVDAARAAAVAAVGPGATVADVHRAAVREITEGLVSLDVLEGDPAELAEEDAHRPFFPHNTSHWLGLDVHDVGDYARGGRARRLEAGMVLTVEPGLYFRRGLDGVPDHLAGIGVRIEDDVLVTPGGMENLTADLPTGADAVEELVEGGG